jgi:NADH-quinone oxidoreductase subunit C
MTTRVPGHEVAERIRAAFPDAVLETDDRSVTVPAALVRDVALLLRDDPDLDCKYLGCLTAVDWLDYFDIVYELSSLAKNRALTLRARAAHEDAVVPSVASVWRGADLQEREVYDLMGVRFEGHPNLRRIFLWEGFPGHPLRKDFLALPGGYKPGLQRFPFEFPEGSPGYEAITSPGGETLPQSAPASEEPET